MNSGLKNTAVIRHFKRYIFEIWTAATAACFAAHSHLASRSHKSTFHVRARLTMSLSCLKPFIGAPEQSLESLTSVESACGSGPPCHLPLFLALPWHSQWHQIAHGSQDMAFCFLHLFLWLSLSCTSQFPGPVAYSFSWGSASSGEFSWTSKLLHLYSPRSRTWSHTHYVAPLYCYVHLPLVQGRACLFDLS